jgi:serine protease inhibitor
VTEQVRTPAIGRPRRRVLLRAALVCALVAGLGLSTSACKQRPDFSQPSTSVPAEGTAVGATTPTMIGMKPAGLISAIDGFGLDLLRQSNRTQVPNTIVSPLSVHAALSMTANGAGGDTRFEMLDALRVGDIGDGGNAQWAGLLREIASRNPSQTIEVANALWIGKGMAFKPTFLATDQGFYGAELSAIDFASDNAVGTINAWFAGKTHGAITQVLDSANPDTALVLTSGAYFKGEWAEPFEPTQSRPYPFAVRGGKAVAVPMMFATRQLPYVKSEGFSATKLMYAGGQSAMYILLPDSGSSVESLINSLDAKSLLQVRRKLAGAKPANVEVGLPKLDTGFSVSLQPTLNALGVRQAFNRGGAQFGPMTNTPVWLESVTHKTRLKLNERGTMAAAASNVVANPLRGDGSSARRKVICDRPFLIAIVDEPTGAMLFLGEIQDPRGY